MAKSTILLAILGYLGVMFKSVFSNLFNMLKTNMTSSISILSINSDEYFKMNEYLINLNKKCFNNNIEYLRTYNNGKESNAKTINFGTYVFIHKKNIFIVDKTLKEKTNVNFSLLTITFIGINKKDVMEEIQNYITSDTSNYIKGYFSEKSFDQGKLILKRGLDSVFFKEKDKVISYIDKWKSMEQLYVSKNIIYKLGILLYGEPGCGKSSLAKAIASYLDYDIHYINLKSNSKNLTEELVDIPQNCVVLLEDIDCIICDREHDPTEKEKETLNIALNFLDGMMSPNKCIIIATTNYIDRLDSAFTRDGRFDLKVELGKLNYEEAEEMCKYYNTDIDKLSLDYPINPSTLQNKLLTNYKSNFYK